MEKTKKDRTTGIIDGTLCSVTCTSSEGRQNVDRYISHMSFVLQNYISPPPCAL